MSGKMARNKGANFERQIANYFKDKGYETRRGIVFAGEPDLVGLDGFHIECKAQEKMHLYDWIEQSVKDAEIGEIPIVIHKQNRKKILVTMELDNFAFLIQRRIDE